MKHTFKDFIPLIGIFIAISIFTGISTSLAGDIDVMYSMRMFMAFFFLIFGLFKVIKWKGFAKAYREYDVVAKKSKVYAYLYPLIEIGLGIAYLTDWNLFYINIVTLIVMLVSAYGVWLKLRLKEEVPCACLGTVFKLPMTKVTLFEDLLMALMALVMLSL